MEKWRGRGKEKKTKRTRGIWGSVGQPRHWEFKTQTLAWVNFWTFEMTELPASFRTNYADRLFR